MFGLFNNPFAISPEETKALLKGANPPKLLDVREKAEWDIVHIKGATLAPKPKLEEIAKSWDKSTPIICYCHHGMRSMTAAGFLKAQGFSDVRSMSGGINAWAKQIEPGMKTY